MHVLGNPQQTVAYSNTCSSAPNCKSAPFHMQQYNCLLVSFRFLTLIVINWLKMFCLIRLDLSLHHRLSGIYPYRHQSATQLQESDITLGQFWRALRTHVFGCQHMQRRVTVFLMRCVQTGLHVGSTWLSEQELEEPPAYAQKNTAHFTYTSPTIQKPVVNVPETGQLSTRPVAAALPAHWVHSGFLHTDKYTMLVNTVWTYHSVVKPTFICMHKHIIWTLICCKMWPN